MVVRAAIVLALLLIACPAAAADHWGTVGRPSAGPARVIGGPANGCIAGAAALATDGLGFQAIRVARNRHWGHPDVIAFVGRLGAGAAAAGLEPFYVGDIAQPRGGPMTFGHGSHQNGLDVDVWFNLDPKPRLVAAEREEVRLPSMVLADQSAIDPARFGAAQVRLLRLAARDTRVDRILVHWTIKRALCDNHQGAGAGDRSWIGKVRPWYGHEAHFHIRLSCPADSPDCQGQPPVPAGDGCDGSLDWWFGPKDRAPAPPGPRPP
ncbi:MAG: penicillin-insensitive murein endopeptidase, partial [Alphaproteobacteria bacterium]|nr:penicillin-insensitive murein endopeptidase [Alphaproteobacteria bacterium]